MRQPALWDDPAPRRRVSLVAEPPKDPDLIYKMQSVLWMGDRWAARAKGSSKFHEASDPMVAMAKAAADIKTP